MNARRVTATIAAFLSIPPAGAGLVGSVADLSSVASETPDAPGSVVSLTCALIGLAGLATSTVVLLRIRKRVVQAEHLDALSAQVDLALRRAEAGDVAGAHDRLAALLPVHERILGAGHPDTRTRWTSNTISPDGRRPPGKAPKTVGDPCTPSSRGTGRPALPSGGAGDCGLNGERGPRADDGAVALA
ncbi:hypothetical protein ACWEU6_27000 [Streptosporangium sandarakinum]|uniref:hypothetical protein n=1 Tax=Streptosporangium sandarakinum TaxID=1260955 RepID=UPI0036ACCECC